MKVIDVDESSEVGVGDGCTLEPSKVSMWVVRYSDICTAYMTPAQVREVIAALECAVQKVESREG